MNRIQQSIATLVTMTLVGLVGCGKAEEKKPPPKVEDTVFGDLVATKERAKVETEKAMEANKQKLEEAMKKSEEPATQ
jgi:hypothetical protein